MAWEHINKIFPTGSIYTSADIFLTNQDIVNNKLKTVSSYRTYVSRNMVYKQEQWVWGEDGEFAIISTFDALNLVPHVDNISPLNVYGNIMIKKFLDDNNIQIIT